MKKRYIWTEDQLITAVKESISIRQVLIKLGLYATGANYKAVPRIIKELKLDTTHFLGRAHTRNKENPRPTKRMDLKAFLVEGTQMATRIKKRLVKEGLLKDECSWCGISTWKVKDEERKLVLQIDHINGISTDNRIENLRILCPNCHSLTDTYAGRNKKIGRPFLTTPDPKKICECGNKKYTDSFSCRKCAGTRRPTKIKWPENEELIKRVQESSFLAVGKELGVSDNAVRSRIQSRGFNLTELGLCRAQK